jgi:Rrf2 family iron-sulfur cluster assembly transcriptional regulator
LCRRPGHAGGHRRSPEDLPSYLEQLFGKLRRFELVSSVRGPGGGYALARDMAAITVADIIAAVDEPLDATSCGGKENCHDAHVCMTHDLWTNLNRRMYEYLHSVTLASLVEQQRRKVAQHAVLHDERAPAPPGGGKRLIA